MTLTRRGGIGLCTLAGGALLLAGLLLDLDWPVAAAAGSGLAAGLLGWLARPAPANVPTAAIRPGMSEMALLLRELAEEMVRLKRDSAEASRGMAEARASAARMVQAASTTIARLDESAETSTIAARALAMLPGIADQHAQRIEIMAARAEQALALVPETLAVPPAFAAALQRLEGIALPDTAALRDAVDRLDRLPGEIGQAMHGSLAEAHDAAAALLDQASLRIEAARPDPLLAMGLMEATERLDALAPPMERASEAAIANNTRTEAALEREDARAARLEAALERLEAAEHIGEARLDAALDRLPPRIADTLARLEQAIAERQPDPSLSEQLQAECDRLASQVQDAVGGLPAIAAALQGLLAPMDAAATALPPMTEAAQRATEVLLRAAQANIALAARAREAAQPAPEATGDAITVPPPSPDEGATMTMPQDAADVLTADAAMDEPMDTAEPDDQPPPAPPTQEPADPPASAPPAPRPPRLLEHLDETIRGLQSLSNAIAAAADRRIEAAH